jgi:hypothetical protein
MRRQCHGGHADGISIGSISASIMCLRAIEKQGNRLRRFFGRLVFGKCRFVEADDL